MFSIFKTVEKTLVPARVIAAVDVGVTSLVHASAKQVEPIAPPPLKSHKWVPNTSGVDVRSANYLAEYEQLAVALGVKGPDLNIERMKRTLHTLDFPVYNLTEVIKYMDDKAAKEGAKSCGWQWHPLRPCDQINGVEFGVAGTRTGSHDREKITPASDYYHGPILYHRGATEPQEHWYTQINPYRRTVPLHALRRMAAIEKEYDDKENAKFFVCDYAPLPAIRNPDPFLMVVVPNPNLSLGDGRFVIDFWDEPGFGIEQMLK